MVYYKCADCDHLEPGDEMPMLSCMCGCSHWIRYDEVADGTA